MVLKFLRMLSRLRRIASASSAETPSKRVSQIKNVPSGKTMTMKSTKPYLLEAMRRWMIDSKCTPQIYARTDILGVQVPPGYAIDNHIMLDISSDAIDDLVISEHVVTFTASFKGVVHTIRLPMLAVIAIHAAENNVGLEFNEEDHSGSEDTDKGESSQAKGKPDLRVL